MSGEKIRFRRIREAVARPLLSEKDRVIEEKSNALTAAARRSFDANVARVAAEIIADVRVSEGVLSYEEARTDSLTGLGNKRRFDETINEWIRNAALKAAGERRSGIRGHSEFAVIMLDLDDFKAINDRFSYDIGNMALQKFALIISRNVGGVVCRYGGDEFVVLADNTGREGAEAIKERVNKILAQEKFAFTHNGESYEIPLGASVGIATFSEVNRMKPIKGDDNPIPGSMIARAQNEIKREKRIKGVKR